MTLTYRCPPECEHHPDDDPIHCPRSRPHETCLIHLVSHPTDERCPTCAAYIAAGL